MKRLSIIFGIVFFAFMIFCTIFAQPIHNYSLPKVTVEKVSTKLFPISFTLEDGTEVTTTQRAQAIPLDVAGDGNVFVIREREHYNRMEAYAEMVPIELGRIEGEYVEVLQGLASSDKLIVKSDREITSGQTVLVLKRE